jgi:hypothetical protein
VEDRLTGFEPIPQQEALSLVPPAQDWIDFSEYYQDRTPRWTDWSCAGPVTYRGHALQKREIDAFLDALVWLEAIFRRATP